MSALPIPKAAAAAAPRTTPCAKKDPKVARDFVTRLREVYCWRNTYIVWACNATLALKLGLTEHQLRHRLRSAERQGLIVRHASRREFERWLETDGGPNLGLDPAGPPNFRLMGGDGRVIVVVELLPPAPPTRVYGPLRLPVEEAAPGDIAPPPPGDIAPPHPMGVFERGIQTEETYVTHASTFVDKDPEPETAERAWAALAPEERQRYEEEAGRTKPDLARLPAFRRAEAYRLFKAERGLAEAPPVPARPSPAISPPLSQGKPRAGSTGRPWPSPAGSARLGRPTLPAVANDQVEGAVRCLLDVVDPADRDVDRMAAAELVGGQCAAAMNDLESEAWWAARVRECVVGRLSSSCLIDAMRGACARDVLKSGAWAVAFVKRNRAAYAIRKADGRDACEASPAAGPRRNP